jgi:hypothetical protein
MMLISKVRMEAASVHSILFLPIGCYIASHKLTAFRDNSMKLGLF